MTPEEIRAGIASFSGSDTVYRNEHLPFVYTEGVRFLVQNAGAHWLLDHIALYQRTCRRDRMLREFQIWKLQANPDHTGVITCLRDTDDPAFSHRLPFTDFPLAEITLYLESEVLMLPGER